MPVIENLDGRLEVPVRVLSEAELQYAGQIDQDEYLWRSLTGNPQREIPKITHERALEVAYALFRQNPLGHRLTDLTRDFVVGDGIEPVFRNPNVEDVVMSFWQDSDNDLDLNLGEFARDLGLWGELCIEDFVGEVSGVVKLGFIDPYQIQDVVHVKGNPLVRDQVLRKTQTGIPEPLDIIRQRSAGLGEPLALAGDVWYFHVNNVSNEARGWPDMLHIADWLDSYDQMLWDIAERARLMRSFIWDVLLKGANDSFIRSWLAQHGNPPKAGTIRAHNENEVWTPLTPTLGAIETAKDADVLKEHLAGGAGVSKHWLSATENVNRATAKEMGTPTERMLGARQRYFIRCVHQILRFVLEKAKRAGRLKTDEQGQVAAYDEQGVITGEMHEPEELVQLHAPEISPKDVAMAGDVLQKLSATLAVAEEYGWFGKDTSRQALAVVFSMLGFEWDPSNSPDDAADPMSDPGQPQPGADNGGKKGELQEALRRMRLGELKELAKIR